jgi:catechol 2,3-dioxygenase-like lactoylglutathione lyase family enzyme
MYKALFLSPMIPSFDIAETADFFTSVLGFSSVMHTDTYAVYQKDGLTVHLLRAGEHIGQMELYVEVDDVDGLWAAIQDKVKNLKTREPFDRDYGMREIHISIPQTNTLLFIGQAIRSAGTDEV